MEAAFDLISGRKKPEEWVVTETILVNRENMFEEECQKILFPFNQ